MDLSMVRAAVPVHHEDGPQINALTVEGNQPSVDSEDSEESISTSAMNKKLTAVATSVDLPRD